MESEQKKINISQIQNVCQSLLKFSQYQQFEYKQLFKQRINKFLYDFDKKNEQVSTSFLNQAYKLKIKFKSDPKIIKQQNQLEKKQQPVNQQMQKGKKTNISQPNIFLYSYQLPCSYQFYQNIVKSQQIQRKADQMINTYKILKQYKLNFQLVQLSYKRLLLISPREFIYMRMFLKSQQTYGQALHTINWIVTFSVPYQKQSDKIRAQIILTVTKIIQNQDKSKITVDVYSEVDMKTSVKAEMAKNKGFIQIKKYVQKLFQLCKNK